MPSFDPYAANNIGKFRYKNADIPAGNTVISALVSNPETLFTSNTEIPSSVFSADSVVSIEARGVYSTGVISLPLTVRVKSGTAILGSVTLTPALSLSNRGWSIELRCNIFDLQTVDIQGEAVFGGMPDPYAIGNSSVFSVNMNNNVPISVSVQWGALALGGSIQLRQLIVQAS
jgi:hypothetical protein